MRVWGFLVAAEPNATWPLRAAKRPRKRASVGRMQVSQASPPPTYKRNHVTGTQGYAAIFRAEFGAATSANYAFSNADDAPALIN